MIRTLIGTLALITSTVCLADNPQVELKTSLGDMTVELYPEKAPESVKNFLDYAKTGCYDGTVLPRDIDGFMIQGGGFDTSLNQKPTRAPIRNEAGNGLKNDTYTLAMARTGEPHSATAQFFINVANNGFLNHSAPNPRGYGYAVFGKVVKGQEVAAKIAKVKTGAAGPFQSDVPLTSVVIEKATVNNTK